MVPSVFAPQKFPTVKIWESKSACRLSLSAAAVCCWRQFAVTNNTGQLNLWISAVLTWFETLFAEEFIWFPPQCTSSSIKYFMSPELFFGYGGSCFVGHIFSKNSTLNSLPGSGDAFPSHRQRHSAGRLPREFNNGISSKYRKWLLLFSSFYSARIQFMLPISFFVNITVLWSFE